MSQKDSEQSDLSTQGRDVGWAVADGETRPIREVLRERSREARKYTRAELDAAYRERAGQVGLLLVCLCCFPHVRCETDSGHEPWCPSEHTHQSMAVVRARYPKGIP